MCNLSKLSSALFIIFLAYQFANAQGYKGIVPMHSTCKDIEWILGGERCGKAEETSTLDKERIRIAYSTEKCQKFYGLNWNIPIGTVVAIGREFLKPMTLTDLGIELGVQIDESEFEKTPGAADVPNNVFYFKKTGGLSISAFHDYVMSMRYYPNDSDESKLVCEKFKRKCNWFRQCPIKGRFWDSFNF